MAETIIDLTTQEGFYRAYFENLKAAISQHHAYEQTELLYMEQHNTENRKYTSFASFRQMKNRWLRTKNS